MRIGIRGIGVWGPGIRDWDGFCALVAGKPHDAGWQAPAPAAIPARERRRAPLMVRLAVEVAGQACTNAGIDAHDIATVFASSMGDTEITDYLCRTLAGESKMLSPTRFHNSVHNAPAGYWSISSANRAPSSSVAASRESFPAAMLEACVQSTAEARPVLLVVSDIVVPGPLGEVYPIGEPFGAALLLDADVSDDDAWTVTVEPQPDRPAWPTPGHPVLAALAENNPAARSVALLEAVAGNGGGPLQWPLNGSTGLRMARVTAIDGE